MAEMTGNNLYVAFCGTALNTDYRNFGADETGDTVDKSAGADTAKTYLATLSDGSASFDGLYVGTAHPAESWDMFAEGTLEWGEQGTTAGSGYPRHYVNAIFNKRSKKSPYNNVIEVSLGWQMSGTITNGTY
jgi:hypothetical protein